MAAKEVIVVFDIGKTNKKVLVYDKQYRIVWETTSRLDEIADSDGFHSESVQELLHFVDVSIQKLMADASFIVRAFNVSAYGASFVWLQNETPADAVVYNYLKPFPEEIANSFYQKYGGVASFSIVTASPALGSLNSGLQLYRKKVEAVEQYEKNSIALHLPQFIAWIIHKQYYTEITSVGCHTALWDFKNWTYHSWVKQESVLHKLAPFRKATEPISIEVYGRDVLVGTGMHDSSAALVPYLKQCKEPFVLLSTGTWCITMNPFNEQPLTVQELEQDVLCYITHKGKQVKASRLFGGAWHEETVQMIGTYFKCEDGWFAHLEFEEALVMDDSREEALSSFPTASSAYHHFMHAFVKKQVHAIRLVTFQTIVECLYVDGGFSHNDIFLQMLKRELPELKIKVATVAQGSSLGAALVLHESWNKEAVPADLITIKSVE